MKLLLLISHSLQLACIVAAAGNTERAAEGARAGGEQ